MHVCCFINHNHVCNLKLLCVYIRSSSNCISRMNQQIDYILFDQSSSILYIDSKGFVIKLYSNQ